MKIRFTKKWKIVIALLSLVCFVAALSGVNRAHPSPFKTSTETKYPTCVAYSDAGIALIDNQGRRMLILNTSGKVTAITDTTLSGSPLNKLTAVFMHENRIFVTGATYFNNGVYVSSESIVEYNMRGKPVRTLYTVNYSESDKINRERFCRLMVKNDHLFLTLCNDRELSVRRIDAEVQEIGKWTMPEPIFSAGYSSTANACVVAGVSQRCYRVGCSTGIVERINYTDYLNTLLRMFGITDIPADFEPYTHSYCIPSLVVNKDGAAQYYSFVSPIDRQLLVLSNDTSVQHDIGNIPFSFFLTLSNILFWLSVALLSIEALLAAGWLLIKRLNRKSKIRLLFITVVLVISVFYTQEIENDLVGSYNESLVTQTMQISYVLSREYGDDFQAIVEKEIPAFCQTVESAHLIAEIHDLLKILCDANGSGQTCYATCYLCDSEGNLYTFADSGYSEISGQPMNLDIDSYSRAVDVRHQPIEVETAAESLVYDYEQIRSGDGTVVGVVSVSTPRQHLNYVIKERKIGTTVGVLALLIGGYMLVKISVSITEDIRQRKKVPASDPVGKSLCMAGTLAFIRGIISGLDAVIVVYVAKSLCDNPNPAWQAVLTAAPIAARLLGTMLGTSLTPRLDRRYGDRALAFCSSIAAMGGMLVCSCAIQIGSLFLYSAGKLLVGMTVEGIIFSLQSTIPQQTDDEGIKTKTLDSVINGTASAVIVSALIGGYISNYFSYSFIYLLGMLLCLLLAAIVRISFTAPRPERAALRDKVEKAVSGGKYRNFFFRGPMLVYALCYLLPFAICAGYKSYLFPLYTSDAGISALLLSYISVFSSTFTLITQNLFPAMLRRLDTIGKLAVPFIIISAGFVLFIISPNVYWAIAMLFIYDALCFTTESVIFGFETDVSEKSGLDAKTVLGMSVSLKTRLNVLQAPVLSAAALLGMNYACTVVGAVCGALFVFFSHYFHRLRKKGKQEEL